MLLSSFACMAPRSRVEASSTATVRGGLPELSELDSSLVRFFSQESVEGGIALYFSKSHKLVCSDRQRCSKRYVPASTFKIPHTLIGIETGVLDPENHSFPWDGRHYSVSAWNRDHGLRSALEVSCVPCFQSIARGVGSERMATWLRRLQYGNQSVGTTVDRFWLDPGQLQITPLEQLQFLWQLQRTVLPAAVESQRQTISALPTSEGPGYVLRAKTGMAGGERVVGWYVGWLEFADEEVFFATVLDGYEQPGQLRLARRRISVNVLSAVTGILIE